MLSLCPSYSLLIERNPKWSLVYCFYFKENMWLKININYSIVKVLLYQHLFTEFYAVIKHSHFLVTTKLITMEWFNLRTQAAEIKFLQFVVWYRLRSRKKRVRSKEMSSRSLWNGNQRETGIWTWQKTYRSSRMVTDTGKEEMLSYWLIFSFCWKLCCYFSIKTSEDFGNCVVLMDKLRQKCTFSSEKLNHTYQGIFILSQKCN
jgi:hypothetical protein